VLVDHFAPYWFSDDRAGRTRPISDRAIREDCTHPIKWPALLIRHARSNDWVRRHREVWPYPISSGRLDFDRLIGQARGYAERFGVPFEQIFPAWMRAGLEQLVGALQSPEAGLREQRLSHVIYGLVRALRNNAALAGERRQHPEIAREEITRPVFIVGINRTGTTLLHRLLSRDPQFWSLCRYELTEPVLSSGDYATVAGTADDPRRAFAEELIGATNVVDTLSGLHRTDIDEPEEDLWILWLTFSTWLFVVAHHVPAYGRWLAEAGSREAYAHHRRVMQHFTWQRRQRAPHGPRHWLLKMPFHLMELEALVETYPDAVFIQTHREPVQVMGSWNSILERIRSFTTEPRPPHETGAEQLALMSGMLNGAMKFRAARPALEARWVDVRYADLVDDPMAVVRAIYDHLGRAVDLCAREGIEVVLENASSIYSDTGANLATIARTLGLKVVWDPANAAASGEVAYPDGYAQVRQRLAHVHFKNWTADNGWEAINDGVVDLAGQVAALKADAFPGYYCLEPHQKDRRQAARLNHAQLLALLGAE
jgi:hypothetical protein